MRSNFVTAGGSYERVYGCCLCDLAPCRSTGFFGAIFAPGLCKETGCAPVYIHMGSFSSRARPEGQAQVFGKPNAVQNRLLELLSPDAYLRAAADFRPVHMAANFVVAGDGERANDAYFPQDCVISLQCATREGASVEFGMIGNEGALGIEVLLEGGRLPGRAVVARAGRALRIPAQALVDWFRRCSPFRFGLLNFSAAFNAQVIQRSICHRVHTIEQQLCTWLLIMHDRSGGNNLDFTHEGVGYFLGGRREGVTIAIRRLRNEGLIRSGYRCLRVLDRTGLEARSCECYGEIRDAYARSSAVRSASLDRSDVLRSTLCAIPINHDAGRSAGGRERTFK